MPYCIRNDEDLATGLAQLVASDPRLMPILAAAGPPMLRHRPAGFAGLAAIVVSQQLSTASAGAIWSRLAAAYDPLAPEPILRARASRLARIGLSAAKIRALKEIARAIRSGQLELDALGERDADEAHRALTAVHGIGPWTADLYLLFCLGHADAWPAGDLALQEAMRTAFALPARPNAREMGELAEGWRPRRGVAAHLLWSYYRVLKRRDPVPVSS